MQPDNLTEIEELAYYKKYHKSRTTLAIIVGIICFLLGFAVARIIYVDFPKAFQQPLKVKDR